MDRKLAKQIRDYVTQRQNVWCVGFSGGEIRCYGVKPNTDEVGWWFAGYVQDVEAGGLRAL